jgi:hypothetical protein
MPKLSRAKRKRLRAEQAAAGGSSPPSSKTSEVLSVSLAPIPDIPTQRPQAEREFATPRILELLLHALLVVVVEETLRRYIPNLLPWGWMLIASLATWDILRSQWVTKHSISIIDTLTKGNRMLGYAVCAIIGAALFAGYWGMIQFTFSKLEAHETDSGEPSSSAKSVTPTSQPTFSLTAYVHGEGGPSDIVLRNMGGVVLELGLERRREPIGDNGQAYFPSIPSNFRGQEVPAWVESDTYVSVDPNSKQALNGSVLYLKVRKKIGQYQLSGTVFDEAGNPLPDVRVVLPEFHQTNSSNQDGRFEFRVAAESQQAVDLIAEKNGYQTAHLSPTLGDTNFSFTLTRSH